MRLHLTILLTLAAPLLAGTPVSEERVEHAGSTYRIYRTRPEHVRLVWKDRTGTPYRTFGKVIDSHGKRAPLFLMNAGIFEPGGIPTGLHIEDGKTLHPLNLRNAPGNFFLKPNGVFWIDTTAHIATSERFATLKPDGIRLATQSGPLLLSDGKRHPKFRDGSASKLHRNGIGVDTEGNVIFAITGRGQVTNLWDFAGLFLKLGCRDALFLDGDISQAVTNPDKNIRSNRFAAIFVITE